MATANQVAVQPAAGLSVKSTPSGRVKSLTPAQLELTSLPSEGFVLVPVDAGLQSGDVIAFNGNAIKLVAPVGGVESMRQRFRVQQAHLEDLFSSLILDGQFVGGTDLVEAAGKEGLAAADVKLCDKLNLLSTVVGLSGVSCTFSFTSGQYPIVSLAGSAAVGRKFDLRNWDVISNSGAGVISLSFDGDIALQLNRGSASLLPKNDLCTSTRDAVVGARVRLFTLAVPTSLPGVTIRVPVCLAVDAKADIAGKVLKFSQRTAVDIAVGAGAAPRLISALPAGSQSAGADMSDTWSVLSTSTASYLPVEVSASGLLAVEAAVEVAASIPALPNTTVVDLGLGAALNGTTAITGKAAPVVVNVGKTLAAIGVDPLYCFDIAVGVDFTLTAFGSLPAMRLVTGGDAFAAKQLLAAPLWKSPAVKLGGCDFKVKTRTAVTGSPNPGRTVVFTVTVAKDDATAGALWDDRRASGNARVVTGTGESLCSARVSAGSGSCAFAYTGAARSETVRAIYDGDDYFRMSDSPLYEQLVSNQGSLAGSATCKILCAPGGGPFACRNFRVDYMWAAEAPVGASIVVRDSLGYAYTNNIDCGGWTVRPHATGVEGVCTRNPGQPERTVVSGSGVGGWGDSTTPTGVPRGMVGWVGVWEANQHFSDAAFSLTCQ